MIKVRCETDLSACRDLWQALIPPERLSDLWEMRECFHQHFQRKPSFIVAEENGQPVGLIPLCWIDEHQYYGYFPGETWHGQTWIEQNRLIARDEEVLRAMFSWLNENHLHYHLRYLLPPPFTTSESLVVDEVGYLFVASQHDHNMDTYYSKFNRRSIKTIKKEVAAFEARGQEIRLGELSDLNLMVQMNLDRFGSGSYFNDQRFVKSFEALQKLLDKNGWLRMVTVLIEGKPAAADIASVYNGAYTLLAGGTSNDFLGIAKVINLYHMKKACEEKYPEADFLCGNFSWKTMFNLHPRPLYLHANIKFKEDHDSSSQTDALPSGENHLASAEFAPELKNG